MLVATAWLFRPVDDNPYLRVASDDAHVAADFEAEEDDSIAFREGDVPGESAGTASVAMVRVDVHEDSDGEADKRGGGGGGGSGSGVEMVSL